jgi:peptidoglycan/LPS O-acetylase OafA/YrhL
MTTWGRWSLSYYLLHQPVLMGLIGMVIALVR